jgi:hypothetical protein
MHLARRLWNRKLTINVALRKLVRLPCDLL